MISLVILAQHEGASLGNYGFPMQLVVAILRCVRVAPLRLPDQRSRSKSFHKF